MKTTPRVLKNPQSLKLAVKEVIRNNSLMGYRPAYFIGDTQDGEAPDLVGVCDKLLRSPTALAAIERALDKFPNLLTLEDFVMRWGSDWGLSRPSIEIARASAETFDKLVRFQRYSSLEQ